MFYSRSLSHAKSPNANERSISSAAPPVALSDRVTLPAVGASAQAPFSSPLSGSAALFPGWDDVSTTHVPSSGATVQSPSRNIVLSAAATPLVR